MMKKSVKALLFIVIVILIISAVSVLCKTDGTLGAWQHYYNSKDKIDVIVFGNSHAHCTVDHGYLWDQYGITGFTLSAGSQQIDSTFFYLKEALRTHKPKVAAIEVYGSLGDEIANSEADVSRNLLAMKWSPTYFEYVNYLAEDMGENHSWRNEARMKIPMIHATYNEMSRDTIYDHVPYLRGYRGSYDTVSFEKPEVTDLWDKKELDSERRIWLQKIIDLCKQEGVNVVFFAAPFMLTDEQQMRLNSVNDVAEENGIPFINFNHMFEEVELDTEKDFRDYEHLNVYGATKVTKYLGDFLRADYGLANHRGESGYSDWEKNSLFLRNRVLRNSLEHAEDLNDYFNQLSEAEENHMYIIELSGNYDALGSFYLDGLLKLGITEEEYRQGGLWIVQKEKETKHLTGEYHLLQNTSTGQICLDLTKQITDSGEEIEQIKMIVNNVDYHMVDNGVNIVVYNEELDQLIDAAADDVYLGQQLIHNEKSADWTFCN